MSGIAVLFPGQGAQFAGMGRDVYEKSAAGREAFERADDVLPFCLSDIIFGDCEEKLTETDVSQPAILATSIAVAEAAREAGWTGEVAACGGLSLGEYTALVFAGALAFEDAVGLVHKRGMYMREAGRERPGGMLSVIGLDERTVLEIAEQAASDGTICAANLNCPGQVVLSGERAALEKAETLAAESGAIKTVFLKVDGAFHSPLMQSARDRMVGELEATRIEAPQVPVVANVTADFVRDSGEIRRLLLEQLTSTVLWERSMRRLLAARIEEFVELGPGRVLTGLLKRIRRKAAVTAVGDTEAIAKLVGPAKENLDTREGTL